MRCLIVPTRREREAVLRALRRGRAPRHLSNLGVPAWQAGDVTVVEPGMGPARAAAILPHLEPLGTRALWLVGWCGGLSEALGVGDLVLGNMTVFEDEQGIAHPPSRPVEAGVRRVAWELGKRLLVGPVLTSGHVLVTAAQKRAGAATGAVAVEMEAGPLARWAADRGLPFVHLRVVLDPVTSALPSERPYGGGSDGHAKRSFLVRALAHPRDLSALFRLYGQIPHASQVITRTVRALSREGGPLG